MHKSTPEGKKRVAEYGVRSYPTFTIINAAGEELTSWVGFSAAGPWVKSVQDVLADPVTLKERIARFEREPTCRQAIALGDAMRARTRVREAGVYYDRALELDDQAARDADVPINTLRNIFAGASCGIYKSEETAALIAAFLHDPKLKQKDAFETARRLFQAMDGLGIETVAPLLALVRTAVTGSTDPTFAADRNTFLADYALRVDKNPEQALAFKRASLPEGWRANAARLNEFAWWCFEAGTNLAEAATLAGAAVALHEAPAEKANALDTQAQIAFLSGERNQAIDLMTRAIGLAPENAYFKEQLKKFQATE